MIYDILVIILLAQNNPKKQVVIDQEERFMVKVLSELIKVTYIMDHING